MHRRFARLVAPLTLLGAAALVLAPASCEQILGLNAFYDCPQDPRCASCTDGKKNGDEADTDCGGSCPIACAVGKACSAPADCQSGLCTAGKCAPPAGPTCADGKKNGAETDVDCGGDCPDGCAVGKKCGGDGDCTSGVCTAGACAPAATCSDTIKNGSETDTDCGGPQCMKCGDGKGCANGGDCVSGVCPSGTCLAPTCTDLTQNGMETDVDCGGPVCGQCGLGQGCTGDTDCAGGSCGADMKCAATCTDGIKDGDETDKDCGGAACPKCVNGGGCAVGGDCASGVCQGGMCVTYYEWAKRFGDSNSQWGDAVAVDTLNNVFLACEVKGTVDFGGGVLTSPSQAAISLAKFDAAGAHVWSKLSTSGQLNHTASMTTDFAGRVVLTGTAANNTDFGGGPLPGAAGPLNFFVAKYDTGGNHLFSKLLAAGNGKAAATSSNGDVLVLGEIFASATNLGCGNLAWSGGSDILVARLNGAFNTCVWSKRFGGTATTSNYGQGIAVDASNNTIVGGRFAGTIDFGCGPIVSMTGGAESIFVVKLDSNGACLWSKAFGDPNNGAGSDPELVGIGVDASGDILAGGYFAGSFDPGNGAVTALGQYDVFAWRLTSSGATSWFKQFGTAPSGYQEPLGFATNAAGRVLLTGSLDPGVDFGGGPLAGGTFVTELDGAGNHMWSRTFAPGQGYGRSVAFSGTSNVVLTGWLLGQIDFGGGALTTMGNEDVFLAKLLVP